MWTAHHCQASWLMRCRPPTITGCQATTSLCLEPTHPPAKQSTTSVFECCSRALSSAPILLLPMPLLDHCSVASGPKAARCALLPSRRALPGRVARVDLATRV